jgi:hypothetical protein
MEVEFHIIGRVIEWRGPAPFYFVPVHIEIANEIKALAKQFSYGWGCIPARVNIESLECSTAIMPKDGGYLIPLKDAIRKPLNLQVDDEVHLTLSLTK